MTRIVRYGALVAAMWIATGRVEAAPAPALLTAEQVYKAGTITGGDLVLFTPAQTAGLKTPGPLVAFAPLQSGDELRVPVEVTADDTYEIGASQLCSPRFGGFRIGVDETWLPVPVSQRWRTLMMRNSRCGQVRLSRGRHVLRLRMPGGSPVHPITIESLRLTPASSRSFYIEAEHLPTVGCDPEPFRPRVGRRRLSGYNEFVFRAKGVGDAVTLQLPKPPAGATHLVVALVGGPDRGIARFGLNGHKHARVYDLYAPHRNHPVIDACVVRVATLPLGRVRRGPVKLSVVCAGRNEKSSGHVLGIDGVAYGVDRTFEAEWLVWSGPWSPHAVTISTRSGRASDRGYVIGDCRDPGKPLETRIELPWSGTFHLEVRLAHYPNQGKVHVGFDGTERRRVVDTYSKRPTWPKGWVRVGTVSLSRGAHTIRFWSRDSDRGRNRVRIDAIRFVP